MKETMRHKQGTILNIAIILHQTTVIKIKLQSSCPGKYDQPYIVMNHREITR